MLYYIILGLSAYLKHRKGLWKSKVDIKKKKEFTAIKYLKKFNLYIGHLFIMHNFF